MRSSMIAVAGLSFAAGALGFWLLGTTAGGDSTSTPTTKMPATLPALSPLPELPALPIAAVPAELPRSQLPATAPAKKLRLPDGSEVEALNGVKEPAPMTWGEGPYAPITGTEFGNGVDWYIHADGTRTTTLEVWRAELGRLDPVTLVYRPGVPAPVEAGAVAPNEGGK